MKQIVSEMIDFLKENKETLKKIKQEDDEIFAFAWNLSDLIEVISHYQSQTKKTSGKGRTLVSHYGNPYITAMLCMEAIEQQMDLVIAIEDVCYGINKAIVKMINDTLKEHKIGMSISLKNNISNQEVEKMDLERVICLGNVNTYTSIRKIKTLDVKFVSLFNMVIYYDSEEYEDLVENIRYFANQNLYEIEILDAGEAFEEVIYGINHGEEKYCATIFSKDESKQEKFRQEVKAKIICINQNPFQEFFKDGDFFSYVASIIGK